jgi:hypothetical protein
LVAAAIVLAAAIFRSTVGYPVYGFEMIARQNAKL